MKVGGMKSYNLEFTSILELKDFLEKYIPQDNKNILLQMFVGNSNTFVLESIIKIIKEHNRDIKIIGTSTDGEILEHCILKGQIVLSFSIFEKTNLRLNYVPINDSFESGKELAKKVIKKETKLVIIFADGLHTNGEEFLKGFESIDNSVMIAGGLSGDNALFIDTVQIADEKISDKFAVAVSFDNEDLIVNNGYNFGWRGMGKDFTITKSHKNVVEEIDNKPVLEIFNDYLGEIVTKELPRIGVEIPFILEKDGEIVARACIGKNKNKLIFAGNIEEGKKVRFTMPSVQLNQEDNFKSIEKLTKNPVETIFVYSCMARRKSLRKQVVMEMEAFSQVSNLSGFFTYGEFFSKKQENGYTYMFFNETTTFVIISEGGNSHTHEIKITKNLENSDLCLLKEALVNFINKTTDELYETNKKLEQKVKEEVEKNLKKNLLIQQQAKHAQMGEMISMIAHQWRQPLNVIALYASNLELDAEMEELKEEGVLETVNNIKKQTQKMSQIIDSFAEFIKPETKKKVFLLKEVIDKSMDIMEAQLKARGIELIINEVKENIYICGYQTLLEQVIINLVSNARDAFEGKKQNKKIEISCQKENEKIILKVKDNVKGGIPKEVQDRIFNPYFTTKGTKGTGLGLYMSKQIIEDKFDGKIYFNSDENGTIFIIELCGSSLDVDNCH